MREAHRVGLACLDAATALLQRIRRAHPTAGLLEAADLQWWWRSPRPTDERPQLFWFDDAGQPTAAAILTDWGDGVALDPILMPDAPAQWVAHVIARGLAHADACGIDGVEVVIDRADDVMRGVLARHGFAIERHDPASSSSLSVVSAWRAADARPAIAPLPAGYRLASRADMGSRPHHLARRSGAGVEARLRQTSLYRAELDLLVLDPRGDVAAYGLFWLDPQTATGLVEPMRTEDDHQRRGLARHLLTAGIDRLAAAGATRIKICFKPDNRAAKALYLDAGFEPDRQAEVLVRRAAGPVSSPG